MKKYIIVSFLVLTFSFLSGNAQYTVLLNFNGANGAIPHGSLTLSGNVLYGMTQLGGVSGDGNIFSININGSNYKDLLDFPLDSYIMGSPPGYEPHGSLTLSGNTLFGMTMWGGNYNHMGNIFSIDTNGAGYSDLNEGGALGGILCQPTGDLTLSDNTLYGTSGCGTVFSIQTNGNNPKILRQDTDGIFYGDVTLVGKLLYGMKEGGVDKFGSIYSIDTNGSGYRDLHDFNDTNGGNPMQSLTFSGSKFYGMTESGGANDSGCIFSIDTNGSNYRVLFSFNYQHGYNPFGALALSGSNLYGMTPYGGPTNDGVVFSIDTNGTGFKDLYYFNSINGINPPGSLTIMGSSLYGMTYGGGQNKVGVIFKLDTSALASVNDIGPITESINVYPNPSKGAFTVQILKCLLLNQKLEFEIYNVYGIKVYSSTLNLLYSTFRVDLSAEPSGVYLYRISGKNKETVATGKIIIEH